MKDDLRQTLECKTRDELNIIAKELRISGYTRQTKTELVGLLLAEDHAVLKRILFPKWWSRYHNHVYGTASIIGVVLAVLFFLMPGNFPQSDISKALESHSDSLDGKLHTIASGVGEPFTLNNDWQRRDRILGIDVDWESEPGGTVLLEQIELATLEQLFRERFLDPNDSQNEAPSAQQFLFFIQKHPETVAHGYAVSPLRSDFRITIDGLFVDPSFATKEMKLAFMEFCKNAVSA